VKNASVERCTCLKTIAIIRKQKRVNMCSFNVTDPVKEFKAGRSLRHTRTTIASGNTGSIGDKMILNKLQVTAFHGDIYIGPVRDPLSGSSLQLRRNSTRIIVGNKQNNALVAHHKPQFPQRIPHRAIPLERNQPI
jgi:hypothetical protein